MDSMITCPYCKKSFEISDAIQQYIEEELLRAKTEQSETLRKEFDIQAEENLKQAVQSVKVRKRWAAQEKILQKITSSLMV